jgi:hypothetical protein
MLWIIVVENLEFQFWWSLDRGVGLDLLEDFWDQVKVTLAIRVVFPSQGHV